MVWLLLMLYVSAPVTGYPYAYVKEVIAQYEYFGPCDEIREQLQLQQRDGVWFICAPVMQTEGQS